MGATRVLLASDTGYSHRVKRLEWANALRGVAALTVLGYHYTVAFWIHQDVSAGLGRRAPLYVGEENAPRWSQFLVGLPVDLGALAGRFRS